MPRITIRDQERWAEMAEELAGFGYWRMDVATRASIWSPNMLRIWGFEAGLDPAYESVRARIHPDDRAVADARLLASLRGEPTSSITRIVLPNGETRHIQGHTASATGPEGEVVAIYGTVVDITEQQATRAALATSEAQLRMLTDHASDLIVWMGLDCVIGYVSPSIERYGHRPEDLVGRPVDAFVHTDDLARVQGLAAELAAGVAWTPARDRRYRLRAASGEHFWVESNPTIVRDNTGAPTGLVLLLRDIAVQKAMEADLQAARDAAEAAAAVKGEFLANMSHELRTPLTSVLGFTRLALEQPELTETSRGYIRKAASAGAALLATVNDILDFSKLEAAQLAIRPEPCDAVAICAETLDLFAETAAAKGVALRFRPSDAPPWVSLDPGRLRQILLNLVGNAVKFSDAGAVTLTVAWNAAHQQLAVSVEDQGPGIGREQQALLFRRFSQVDGSSTRRHAGTGLGLAICRGLVEAMDGEIGVESILGAGARFHVTLPAPPAAAPAPEAKADAPVITPGTRLLVADDHEVNRELVRAVLSPLGAVVTEVADGAAAVAAATRTPFDLILMDLRMPAMGGLEAMQAIRGGAGPNREAPILAFSAGADPVGEAARRRAGFDGDLRKPLLPADLVAAVALHTAETLPSLRRGAHAA